MPAIGIDLGTTYSCVGVWQHGKVEIIANNQGNRTTPSCVAFTREERIIGEGAKHQIAMNPQNTVFDAKRLIGRKFNDPKIQQDMRHWPFTVIEENSKPKIRVEYKGQKRDFFPEEISSIVLKGMKEIAETYLGTEVKDAVITVPAYFNDAQRYATKQAACIAGLNVMRIFHEPSAAAVAYGLHNNVQGEKTVLVFDLGGGTFDVSVLKIIKNANFIVLSTSGNTHLGGEDFDNCLVDYLKDEFKRKFKIDISDNPKALRRLRTAAEQSKRMLSAQKEASVNVDALHSGIDFFTNISRARFEDMCLDLFESTIASVADAIEGAKLTKSDIDEVVLVGGSSRIPKIQKLIQDFFEGKSLNFSINPDEAVAYGAAVTAAVLSGDAKNSIIENVLLTDVTPLSLGKSIVNDIMSVIIERNTRIPCERSKEYFTVEDNQESIHVIIYEGERLKASENNVLSEFDVKGLPPAPRGEVKVLYTFQIDEDGILEVTAKVQNTGDLKKVIVNNECNRLSKQTVDKMILDAIRFKEEDELHCKKMKAKSSLEDYMYEIKHSLAKIESSQLPNTEMSLCNEQIHETLAWLKLNDYAHQHEYESKLNELKKKCSNILEKIL